MRNVRVRELAHAVTRSGSVLTNADPDLDAKATAWSPDSRRHAEELTGVSLRMMLAEPVQADKCINRSQVPFVRLPLGGDP